MSEETKTEMAKKEYKLVSAIGTFMTALGKGRIYSTITMDEEKMTIQTKPAKKSTIPGFQNQAIKFSNRLLYLFYACGTSLLLCGTIYYNISSDFCVAWNESNYYN